MLKKKITTVKTENKKETKRYLDITSGNISKLSTFEFKNAKEGNKLINSQYFEFVSEDFAYRAPLKYASVNEGKFLLWIGNIKEFDIFNKKEKEYYTATIEQLCEMFKFKLLEI